MSSKKSGEQPEQAAEPKRERHLTSRQQRFVREYLIDPNGTKAAIKAGYSEHSAHVIAHDLLKNPLVAAHVEELQNARAEALGIDAADVIAGLIKIRSMAMQAEEVVSWDFEEKCFAGTGEYKFDGSSATKASELLGKHLGMFKDRSEVKVTTESTEAAQLAALLTPEELEVIRQRVSGK